jgi:glycerol uptake facilitator-like aquaporin
MERFDIARRLTSEALGTALLVAAVIGSGIMAAKLAGGNTAIALLCNTLATGAILVVIITIFAPISGAHFNPVVSLVMAIRGDLDRREALAYMLVQIVGGCLGALFAHLMFGLDPFQLSTTARTGLPQWLAEFVATFGLLITILGCVRFRPDAVAFAVGLYITSAYGSPRLRPSLIPPCHRAVAERHLRRHRTVGRTGLHRRAGSGSTCGGRARRLAVRVSAGRLRTKSRPMAALVSQ